MERKGAGEGGGVWLLKKNFWGGDVGWGVLDVYASVLLSSQKLIP